MTFEIGGYQLKIDTQELLCQGVPQKVEPLIFKLLIFLLRNPDRLITREEIMNTVWAGRIISDSALNASISTARRTIGDNAKKQHYIKTVSGLGYRFIGKFNYHLNTPRKDYSDKHSQYYKSKAVASFEENAFKNNDGIMTDKPSVAVMDFKSLSNDAQNQLLSSAITHDIQSGLARLPHLFVIAKESSSQRSKQNLASKQAASSLGVRYLVYGSTFCANKRIQIDFNVVDSVLNKVVWMDHYTASLDDVFYLQNEILQTIVYHIDVNIEQSEIDRAFLVPTEDLNAWESYHRGVWYMDRITKDDVASAQYFFEQAVSKDPRFSRAYAGLSYSLLNQSLLESSILKRSDNNLLKACDYAQLGIDICNKESMAFMALGRAKLFSDNVHPALQLLNTVIRLRPSTSHGLTLKAMSLVKMGENHSKVKALLDASKSLNPNSLTNMLNYYIILSMLENNQQNYRKAAAFGIRAVEQINTYYLAHAITAGNLQLSGQTKKAQQYAKQALEILPSCTTESCQRVLPLNKIKREIFIKSLVDSGIPSLNKTGVLA